MIPTPIAYNSAEAALVTAFDSQPTQAKRGDYWSNCTIEKLRSRIKEFYINAQNRRCCYCNMNLFTINHRAWDVEHIAPRSKHPHFMFTPKNLAVSCLDCNNKKADQEVLVNKDRKTYPKHSKDFRIVHPHFDKFEDHIQVRAMVYIPKTEKGKITIYICDLLRFAQLSIEWENSAADNRFEADIDDLFNKNEKISEAAVDSIMKELRHK
jgi:uncharacterized protein (TIGR02646 family)